MTGSGLGAGDVTTVIKGIEIGGEIRARYTHLTPDYYDGATGTGVTRGKSESDDTGMLRTRLRADLTVADNVKGAVELQDTHINGATAVGTDDGGVTVRQGYLFVSDITGRPVDLKVGRYTLKYGNGDLLCSGDWGNTSRHFDGAILTYRSDSSTKIDLGYAELVNGDVNDDGTAGTNSGAGGNVTYPGRAAGIASDPDEDSDIYWLWITRKVSDEFTFDGYDIMEYDGESNYIGEAPYLNAVEPNPQVLAQGSLENQGHLKRHTTGVQLNWDNQDFYGNASYNGQWGTIASDQIRAVGWSWYAGARFDREGLKHDLKAGVRYASGDGDANDRESTRFRPLFHGGAHEANGILDLVGWSNSVAKYVTYAFSPHGKVRVTTSYIDLERYNDDDSWYNDAGTVLRTGKAFDSANPHPEEGMSGSRDIGEEVDVVINYKHTDFLDFEGGLGHFFKGRLAEETSDLPDAQFTYVQARLRF